MARPVSYNRATALLEEVYGEAEANFAAGAATAAHACRAGDIARIVKNGALEELVKNWSE